MNKILISTVSYKKEPLDLVLEVFNNIGFKHIELHLYQLYKEIISVEIIKKSLDYYKIVPHVLSGGWCNFFDDTENLNETFFSIEKQVNIAKELNCKTIRLFFGRLKFSEYSNEKIKIVVKNLIFLSKKYQDIRFVFENHDGITLNPKVCLQILKNVHKENIRMNFDPINFEKENINSEYALKLLFPYIENVHLKGYYNNNYCEYGNGDYNLNKLINKMLNDNYQGYFTLEYEGKNNPTIRLLKAYKKLKGEIG